MKMDNSDFKRKAVETTGLFGKLTNALNKIPGVNLGKVTKSFGDIQKAADGTNLSGIQKAIDNISSRFGALNVVATTALVNIANRAVDTGITMMKSLGPDQIMAGFQEYELKMGSIGTMLANTEWEGATLDDVNRILNTLNDYADKTIYNFAEMTASIGRFTAAGVKLEDSAIAIKGLGNLAAISGSDTNQLNTAMYQMSQMMAAGKMNLQDWNSLVNAGMAGKKTQDGLLETAKAMGVNVDMSEGFRNSISDGWLTAEVFLETMKRFGEDESMTEAATKVRTFSQMIDTLKEGIGSSWAESFEIIIGDFEEATKLWTAVSEFVGGIFEKQGKARNKMLRAIFDGEGLPNVLKGLKNILTPIGQLFGAIGKGFKNAFPPLSIDTIKNLVTSFAEWTESLKFSESTVSNLKTIFSGFFSMFAIGWKIIKGGIAVVLGLLPSFDGLGAKILELIARVANIPKAFNDANSSGEAFAKVMDVIKKVASGISSVLEALVGGLILFVDVVTAVIKSIATGDFAGPWDSESEIVGRLKNIRESVVNVADAISEAWSILTEGDFTGKGPWAEESFIVSAMFRIRDAFIAMGDAMANFEFSQIGDAFSSFIDSLKTGYNWLVDTFSNVWDFIKSKMPNGNQLFAGGFVAGMVAIVALVIKKAWELKNMFEGWGGIGEGISETLESVSGALDSFAMSIKVNALLTISIALGILAASFWVLSGLDGTQIANGLYMIIGSLSALVGAMAIMGKYDISGTGMGAAVQIVALSIAFSILAGALRKVSDMKWGEITKGLYGLAGVMGVFAGAVALMSKFGGPGAQLSALQMIALAGTVHLLVIAMKDIADMKPGQLTQGILGLAGLLAAFAGAVVIMSRFGKGKIGASSLQFVAIAGSILIMVEAMRQITKLPVDDLKTGLQTLGIILGAIAAFTLLTSGGDLLSTGSGLVLLAGALTLIVIPVRQLGEMDPATLAIGLTAMAVALGAIGLASKLMTGMAAAGAGLMLIAGGITMIVGPLALLGNMDLKVLAIGIGALAAAILLIGGAATLLGLAGPALLLGAAGIAALGVAMLAAGLGISLFSTGLVTLAAMTAGAVTTIVATLGTLIIGLISLIPTAVDFIVQLTMQIATAIAENAPILAEKVWTTLLAIMTVIAENAPLIYEQFLQLILGIVQTWGENMPKIVDAVMVAVTTMLTTIAGRVGEFIDAGVLIITNFITGVGKTMSDISTTAMEVVITFIESMTTAVRENGPKMTRAVLELMGSILLVVVDAGVQMVNALFGWIPGVKGATAEIGRTAEKYIEDNFGAEALGTEKGTDFSGALGDTEGGTESAAEAIAKAAEDALDVDMSSAGGDFGKGFASGINSQSVMSRVASAARSVASKAATTVRGWLNIASPSRVMRKDGGWFGEGFALGIVDKAKMVGDNAKKLAITAKDSLNQFLDGFELPEDDNELHFKAVIDYDSLDTSRFGSLGLIPDTSLTRGLASATRADIRRQNRNNQSRGEGNITTENHEYHYEINVTAGGSMSRAEVKKLAKEIQTEIKNTNDKGRIGRGEVVIF